jgi:hypothetical protein
MNRIICILGALLCAAVATHAADTIEVFGHKWTVFNKADWNITQEDGSAVLHLVTAREPLPGPRRPIQFAVADTPDWDNVIITADVKPLRRSLIVVFAYRDAAHFDYAHLSTDTGTKQPVHNGIFHVYGGERVRISSPGGPAAFPSLGPWYHAELGWDGKTGTVDVTVNGKTVPALHAVDLSLPSGKVGLGSFDETAEFKNVKIDGSLTSETDH